MTWGREEESPINKKVSEAKDSIRHYKKDEFCC
jgi:hypothetical protein